MGIKEAIEKCEEKYNFKIEVMELKNVNPDEIKISECVTLKITPVRELAQWLGNKNNFYMVVTEQQLLEDAPEEIANYIFKVFMEALTSGVKRYMEVADGGAQDVCENNN